MALLESMMKVVQDTHVLALKNDRRVGALEAELEVLTYARPLTSSVSSDVTEVKGQGATSDSESTQNVEEFVADLKKELTNMKETMKIEAEAARTQHAEMKVAIDKVTKETSAMKVSLGKELSGMTKRLVDSQLASEESKRRSSEILQVLSDVKSSVGKNDLHLIQVNDFITQLKSDNDDQADRMTSSMKKMTSSLKKMTSSAERMQTEISEVKDTAADTEVSVTETRDRLRRLTLISACQLTKVHQQMAKMKKTSQKTLKSQHNRLKRLLQELQRGQEEKLEKQKDYLREKIKNQFRVGGKFFNILTNQSQAVIDQIMMESQITRDILQVKPHTGGNPAVPRGIPQSVPNMSKVRQKYIFHFHVKNLSEWWWSDNRRSDEWRSSTSQFSRVCYIDQANTYIKARARFDVDCVSRDCIRISLQPGRNPATMGLEPAPATQTQVLAQLMDDSLCGSRDPDSLDISGFVEEISQAGHDVTDEEIYEVISECEAECTGWANNGINCGVLAPLKDWTIDEARFPWDDDSWLNHDYYHNELVCGYITRSTLEELGYYDDAITLRFEVKVL